MITVVPVWGFIIWYLGICAIVYLVIWVKDSKQRELRRKHNEISKSIRNTARRTNNLSTIKITMYLICAWCG